MCTRLRAFESRGCFQVTICECTRSLTERRRDITQPMGNQSERLTVVIAEDDEDAIHLLEAALQAIACEHTVRIVRDGQDALDYLKGEGQYADRKAFPFPDVLLIDLKMPVVSGMDVL